MTGLSVGQVRYKVLALFPGGAVADVTGAVTGLAREDAAGELATRLTVELEADAPVGTRGPARRALGPGTRLIEYVALDQGGQWQETFRGTVWDHAVGSAGVLTLVCYDDLIYLTRSEDAVQYPEGTVGRQIILETLRTWLPAGAVGDILGPRAAMPKIAFQGTVSDLLLQVLQHALAVGDKAYWLRAVAGQVHCRVPGPTTPLYRLTEFDSVSDFSERTSLADYVTEVRVLGAQREGDDQTRPPVVATASAEGTVSGRLVVLLDGAGFDTPAVALAAARTELEKRGRPTVERTITALAIPLLRRGDVVGLTAGTTTGVVQVAGLSVDEDEGTMQVTVAEVGTPLYQAQKIEEQVEADVLGPTAAPAVGGTKVQQLLRYARAHLGTPYVWGGKTPAGWDCSGFTACAFQSVGLSIGGGTGGQSGNPRNVRVTSPQPGDLVLFHSQCTDSDHVGIVSETPGIMYNASSPGTGTIKSSIAGSAAYHCTTPDYRRVVGLNG